ncbi:alanyl-tRNA editing protein [Paludibacterium yongneupense]|uniref:alanyl-tRNA editing protein n=1 Tax=Paludibacterium yongneupense TaxID=400061 RepID=UPI00040A0EC4|nr:alanyl-tRNA editing protein [Paludibacterium yongneupense]
MQEQFYLDSYQTRLETRVLRHDAQGLVLENTLCYPLGGGQPGDRARLQLADGSHLDVIDTRRDKVSRDILHLLPPDTRMLAPGTAVTLELDWERRYRHMRVHGALHLLSAVVPHGVTGGNIGDGSGRLDFSLPEGIELDRGQIEGELNRLVAEDRVFAISMTSGERLRTQPDLIKTMSVTPPLDLPEIRLVAIDGVDLQPCGGTHVRATGEIGALTVSKIENKGARNKRVVIALLEPETMRPD